MRLIAPDWYPSFRCIADACKHTCCAGWEIDIDDASLQRFRSMAGAVGDRLRGGIAIDEDGHGSFILDSKERCPMLQPNGLCALICHAGEDALCQICADHPRFRNWFADRIEIGLGLCCEAAAQLILTWPSPMQLITLEDDGTEAAADPTESSLLALRDRLLDTARNRAISPDARMDLLLHMTGAALPPISAWKEIFLDLERLDPEWTLRLSALPQTLPPIPDGFAIAAEQLLCYFLFRHLPGALQDGSIRERTALCVLLVRLILSVSTGPDDLIDAARQCSAEIEYSDENIDTLLDILTEY